MQHVPFLALRSFLHFKDVDTSEITNIRGVRSNEGFFTNINGVTKIGVSNLWPMDNDSITGITHGYPYDT